MNLEANEWDPSFNTVGDCTSKNRDEACIVKEETDGAEMVTWAKAMFHVGKCSNSLGSVLKAR